MAWRLPPLSSRRLRFALHPHLISRQHTDDSSAQTGFSTFVAVLIHEVPHELGEAKLLAIFISLIIAAYRQAISRFWLRADTRRSKRSCASSSPPYSRSSVRLAFAFTLHFAHVKLQIVNRRSGCLAGLYVGGMSEAAQNMVLPATAGGFIYIALVCPSANLSIRLAH